MDWEAVRAGGALSDITRGAAWCRVVPTGGGGRVRRATGAAAAGWTVRWCAWRGTHYLSLMIDWSTCSAVERDPERYSGAWLFRETRVPVAALFENLEDDAQVQDFLDWFPGVTRDQVRAVLEHAAQSALSAA